MVITTFYFSMLKLSIKLFLALFVLTTLSCVSAPEFGDTPKIEFVEFSKAAMNQGDLNNDSTTLILKFEDGDGDVGSSAQNGKVNLTIIDNRNNEIYDNIKLPKIPQDGAHNGVKGTMYIKLFTGCCLFNDKPNCTSFPQEQNKFTLDIYMIDDAGNQSNTITTDELTLLCI